MEAAVQAFASLPGIGKKTALRLVLHLIDQETEVTREFAQALVDMREHIKSCQNCHNLSDQEICSICQDPKRNRKLICVVESIRDVMAIEDTAHYHGLYHVLGGVISPIEGVGPEQLNIDSLLQRIEKEEVQEIIMAISPTIEGDTTIYYISKQLQSSPVNISTIARGVAFGGELEYADGITLGRSIATRNPYKLEE